MKIKKLLALFSSLAALVLEILPYGAVLRFAMDEGVVERRLFSYFDMTVYGYANFYPLLTGILTVLLLCLLTIGTVKKSEKIEKSAFLIAFSATAMSVLPILQGWESYSLVGGIITACLLASTLLLFRKDALK